MLPVSVIILTHNEEALIEDCLKSLRNSFADVFILDSFSTDKTIEIARKYSDKIFEHEFVNYSIQRNWAQENLPIKTEWIFHLDADERLTEELLNRLKDIFSSYPIAVDGIMIPRRTTFMHKWIKHGGHYPVYHLRIFKKSMGRCEDRLYDQHFMVDGKIVVLGADIIDVITSNIFKWMKRQSKWAKLEALEATTLYKGGQVQADRDGNPIKQRRWMRQNYYRLPLFIRPFLYFFYRYLFKMGFLDGARGLVFHLVQGLWFRMLVDIDILKIKSKSIFSSRGR